LEQQHFKTWYEESIPEFENDKVKNSFILLEQLKKASKCTYVEYFFHTQK